MLFACEIFAGVFLVFCAGYVLGRWHAKDRYYWKPLIEITNMQKREYPGPWSVDADPSNRESFARALEERNRKIDAWDAAEEARIQRIRKGAPK